MDKRRNDVLPDLWRSYLEDSSTGSTGYSASDIVNSQPNLCVLPRLSTVPVQTPS